MKNLFLLCVSVLTISSIHAQDITDALRYSENDIFGSARYRALSGAFGALGGDISAINTNPAGTAIFNATHLSLSLSNSKNTNDTQYFNGFSSNSNTNFDLNQAGAAFVFNNRNPESSWKKFAVSVAYNTTQNFDDDWFAFGTNGSNAAPGTSVANYFLENAQGLRLDEISAFVGESDAEAYAQIGNAYGFSNQQAFLGYTSFIVEPDSNDDANTTYFSNVQGASFNQEHQYYANGYNGKFTLNFATQYKDNLYLGLNLNTHFIDYNRVTRFFESNDTTGAVINEIYFENALATVGSGFSFQIGGILKITPDLRVGLAFDSPTWYIMEDETTQYIDTASYDGIPLSDGSTFRSTIIDPQVINIFPQYTLRTPGKLTGSLAYIFGSRGLISFDYSIKDYSNSKFLSTSDFDYDFSFQNNMINNTLTTAATYKIGGELKHKNLSFRAGYKLEESPYKNGTTIGDLKGYSLGFGYGFGKAKLDLSFNQSKRSMMYQLFDVGLTDSASIDVKNSNITMSLSFNL
jgi:hypothetical protein